MLPAKYLVPGHRPTEIVPSRYNFPLLFRINALVRSPLFCGAVLWGFLYVSWRAIYVLLQAIEVALS